MHPSSISAFSQPAGWPYLNWNIDAPSSSSFVPASPYEENQALLDYYHHHQNVAQNPTNIISPSLSAPDNIKKQKTPGKERYRSKILTANGPRDRRVRFSVEISRKFFGLQDLLGFQKPSKTLNWLLTEAKPAIKELLRTSNVDNNENARFLCSSSSEEVGDSKKTRKRENSKTKDKRRLLVLNQMIGPRKESRAKARERARERTQEKNLLRNHILLGNSCNQIGTAAGEVFLNSLAHEESWLQECLRMQRNLFFASGQVSSLNIP